MHHFVSFLNQLFILQEHTRMYIPLQVFWMLQWEEYVTCSDEMSVKSHIIILRYGRR